MLGAAWFDDSLFGDDFFEYDKHGTAKPGLSVVHSFNSTDDRLHFFVILIIKIDERVLIVVLFQRLFSS